MPPRDTRTGGVLESMVLPALKRGGYHYAIQVHIGNRLGGGKHIVDVVAGDEDGRSFLISVKWQQTSGTAEQKVPFEVICLAEAVRDNPERYERAYVVLGGPGWKLREFYVSGGLERHLVEAERVRIVALEEFVARANKAQL
jgi:hypothetical protein